MAITAPPHLQFLGFFFFLHYLTFQIYIFYTLRLLLLFQMLPYEYRYGLYIQYKCVFIQFFIPGLFWCPDCT